MDGGQCHQDRVRSSHRVVCALFVFVQLAPDFLSLTTESSVIESSVKLIQESVVSHSYSANFCSTSLYILAFVPCHFFHGRILPVESFNPNLKDLFIK